MILNAGKHVPTIAPMNTITYCNEEEDDTPRSSSSCGFSLARALARGKELPQENENQVSEEEGEDHHAMKKVCLGPRHEAMNDGDDDKSSVWYGDYFDNSSDMGDDDDGDDDMDSVKMNSPCGNTAANIIGFPRNSSSIYGGLCDDCCDSYSHSDSGDDSGDDGDAVSF